MRAEQVQVASVIVIVEEGLRPAVAALGHMVRVTRKDGAGEAGHEGQPATRRKRGQLVHCHRNPTVTATPN